jgi:hypothetical protein
VARCQASNIRIAERLCREYTPVIRAKKRHQFYPKPVSNAIDCVGDSMIQDQDSIHVVACPGSMLTQGRQQNLG